MAKLSNLPKYLERVKIIAQLARPGGLSSLDQPFACPLPDKISTQSELSADFGDGIGGLDPLKTALELDQFAHRP